MRYHKIRKMDISNGPGVRVSIFIQGCTFHCKNCFNPETWDFKKGKDLTDEVIEHLLELCDQDYIRGLSILGGEPLHPKNIEGVTNLAKEFKKKFPKKDLWLWSGYVWEEDIEKQEIIKYIDVLVDGQYQEKEHDPTLKYRGSRNQRVIDVKKTLKNKKIIQYESR